MGLGVIAHFFPRHAINPSICQVVRETHPQAPCRLCLVSRPGCGAEPRAKHPLTYLDGTEALETRCPSPQVCFPVQMRLITLHPHLMCVFFFFLTDDEFVCCRTEMLVSIYHRGGSIPPPSCMVELCGISIVDFGLSGTLWPQGVSPLPPLWSHLCMDNELCTVTNPAQLQRANIYIFISAAAEPFSL